MAETNLKGMVYFLKHKQRISHALVFGDVVLADGRWLYSQRGMEQAHKDLQQVPTVNTKDWPSTMELVVTYIDGHCGVDKHPLGYVIRDELIPTAEGDDPTVRAVGSTYFSHDDELRARAKIIDGVIDSGTNGEVVGPFTDTYIANRKKVCELLCAIFQNSVAWVYMKKAKKYYNGRKAYKSIDQHYLGSNNVDHMAGTAKRALTNSLYTREKKG